MQSLSPKAPNDSASNPAIRPWLSVATKKRSFDPEERSSEGKRWRTGEWFTVGRIVSVKGDEGTQHTEYEPTGVWGLSMGFENVPLFRGDWVPAEGWVDGIWRGCGRIGGGG